MTYCRVVVGCLILMSIAACDTAVQITPVNKPAEKNTTPIAQSSKVIVVPQQSAPLLNLSIDDVSFDDQKNNDDTLFESYGQTGENSAMFNELSKRQTPHGLELSGELLTDKTAGDTKDFLESVDGINIKVKGSFN